MSSRILGPSVDLIVPWRDLGNPHRAAAYERVLHHLNAAASVISMFDLRVVIGSADPWSPGAARNAAAAASTADLLFFNDADSILSYRAMQETLEQAWAFPGLVYGYDLYLRLDEAQRVERSLYGCPSMGAVAIRRDCFLEVDGFDERFQGWGYEDVEFAERCGELWPVYRMVAPLYHLWHGERNDDDSPADSDPVEVAENLRRWKNAPLTV